MKLSEAVIKQEDKNSYLTTSLEFDVDDRVWVRPLKMIGAVVELPTFSEENYTVKLDNESVVKVNWYNLFLEEDKDRYNFQPIKEVIVENVVEKI